MHMKGKYENTSRRDFFRLGGLCTVPLLLPPMAFRDSSGTESMHQGRPPVNFIYDGPWFSPRDYMDKLEEIDRLKPIEPDVYCSGGVTRELEEEFARITGKEKAIYLPSGTMANQLAMKLLNGNLTKVIVPENSHIFRDEADAAQSVHRLRTIPLGKDKAYFDLNDLKEAITSLEEGEVFRSGPGTVVIENPIRRADGTVIPLDILKELTAYCREHGYKLHLDGARIHIASAYSKVPVTEYAALFDTIYISLYKYLNAAGGGILCGDAALIDQVPHQIKILGGSMLQSWYNTAMALHYLDGVEERWDRIRETADALILELNQISGIKITPVKNGSNVYDMMLEEGISLEKFTVHMRQEHGISFRPPEKTGIIKFKANQTLLNRQVDELLQNFKSGIHWAGG